MKKTIVTLGLVAVLLAGGTYAYSQGPGFGPGPGPGPHRGDRPHWGKGDFGSALNLTPEQKDKIGELRKRFKEENAQLIGTMVTKKIEIQSLWSNPNADPTAIQAKEKEMRALQNEMRDKAVQMRLEARKILTPEQIARLGQGRGFGRCGGRGGFRQRAWGAGPGI